MHRRIHQTDSLRPARNGIRNLRGIGKETFGALGGGENWLRRECESFDAAADLDATMNRNASLAGRIAGGFYENRWDLSDRDVPAGGVSWAGMPEVAAVGAIRERGATVRLFLTFLAAMDRARDAGALWSAGVSLFEAHPEVFDPCRVADLPPSRLGRLLQESGVSQRHGPDADAWRRIAASLAEGEGSPVHDAIYRGVGDAEALLCAVRGRSAGEARFPMLRGPKIGPMWVRMLAEPGGAEIARIGSVEVAVDVQVRRITENLGVADTQGLPMDQAKPLIQSAWRSAVAQAGIGGPSRISGTCAALDPALWSFGKYGCSHCEREQRRLPISPACGDCQLFPQRPGK